MTDLVAETDRPAKLSRLLPTSFAVKRNFVGHLTELGVLCDVVCSGELEKGIGNELKSSVAILPSSGRNAIL
jgi:hypothetical protein